jgi:hypothetical protein
MGVLEKASSALDAVLHLVFVLCFVPLLRYSSFVAFHHHYQLAWTAVQYLVMDTSFVIYATTE